MKQFLPALAAVGGACGLVAGPAFALELGDLTVESKLGQPLRASIAYALQPHEQLSEFCIYLNPGVASNGLAKLSKAKLSIRGDSILLTGNVPIREPMLGLQLSVNCPYTARLQREYTLFFDFDSTSKAQAANAQTGEASRAPALSPRNADAPPRRSSNRPSAGGPDSTPVAAKSRYRVKSGDSLSGIVARISDRPAGLWAAVNAVFAANPHAFIDGDVNLIKAGSWLEIPDLYQALGSAAPLARPDASPPAKSPAPASIEEYDGFAAAADSSSGAAVATFDSGILHNVEQADAYAVQASGHATATTAPATSAANADLRPGDIILGDDSPFVSPIRTNSGVSVDVIPDTSIPVPVATASSAATTSGTPTDSWSFLAWLGGAGLAIFLGLLLFGRRVRKQFGSSPIGESSGARPKRRSEDSHRQSAAEVDFEFDKVSGDTPSMLLDADLGLGTGLGGGADIDVAQDFGFSASADFASDFDFEIPSGAGDEPEQQSTDIIPPNRQPEASILESEVPPSDDDDEYDLSMIVDVTRQPVVDTHLTAKDLKAIPVEVAADDANTDEYTLNREVDYKILERDYEEELTTTQALNADIARAAMELAESMGKNSDHLEKTVEMPQDRRASTSMEVTAQLPSSSDSQVTAEITAETSGQDDAVIDQLIGDLDDTGVNEELTADLPRADNDVTAEMTVEGGRIDTRKSKAS